MYGQRACGISPPLTHLGIRPRRPAQLWMAAKFGYGRQVDPPATQRRLAYGTLTQP